MIFLYNFSIRLYFLLIRLVSLWNKKARLWLEGRKNLFEQLENKITGSDRVIWVHCSSAGEFEQGKPVIEKLKQDYPAHKILVSFFSPSGYQLAENYPFADFITYLPLDTKSNARRFLGIIHPDLVIFIKYEFWYHHLSQANFRHIPVLLSSAVFREDQLFFKSYGRFYRQLLFLFRHIFVQDKPSLELLKNHSINHCSIGGDTRFDRVSYLSSQNQELPVIKHFVNEEPTLVAGSTWSEDESMIAAAWKEVKGYKIILAPHEISDDHISAIQKKFPGSLKYSTVKNLFDEENSFKGIWNHINKEEKTALLQKLKESKILIIDNVGMLSRLYAYASISYVGGGFSKDGIHNVLEPAAYGKPILTGPNYEKYREAKELIAAGAAASIASPKALHEKINEFFNNQELLESAGRKAFDYVKENAGASIKISNYIQENRLLTSW